MMPPLKTSPWPFLFLNCFYRMLSVDTCAGSLIIQSDFYSPKIIDLGLLFRVYSYHGYGLFSLRLIGAAMFGATFNLVTRIGLP